MSDYAAQLAPGGLTGGLGALQAGTLPPGGRSGLQRVPGSPQRATAGGTLAHGAPQGSFSGLSTKPAQADVGGLRHGLQNIAASASARAASDNGKRDIRKACNDG